MTKQTWTGTRLQAAWGEVKGRAVLSEVCVCVCVCMTVGPPAVLQRRDPPVCPERFPQVEDLQSFQLEQVVLWRSVSHFKVKHQAPSPLPCHHTSSSCCPDIIDFLQLNVVPQLRDKLRLRMLEEAAQGAEQSNLGYLLSDIFCSEDEDGFVEVDNS